MHSYQNICASGLYTDPEKYLSSTKTYSTLYSAEYYKGKLEAMAITKEAETIKNVSIFLRLLNENDNTEDSLQNNKQRLISLCTERGYPYTLYEEIVSNDSYEVVREAFSD